MRERERERERVREGGGGGGEWRGERGGGEENGVVLVQSNLDIANTVGPG